MGIISPYTDKIFRVLTPNVRLDPKKVSYLGVILSLMVPFAGKWGQVILIFAVLILDSFDGYLARKSGNFSAITDTACDTASAIIMFMRQPFLLGLSVFRAMLKSVEFRWKELRIVLLSIFPSIRHLYLAWLLLT